MPPPPGAISIDALQRLGLIANGLVHAAQFQVEAAEAGVIAAAAYPNPQVMLTGGPQHPRIAAANPATYHRAVTVIQSL
ncbi:MAG: TolC family protein, partial [Nitrosospira sp.]|nr:TolC family protein [Nitrosospira sp.]